ncbi:MAG: polysaccharide biosynthesis tyrosine autokinase [Deltaproteobacteria bacterium]|nr:polysaccharide biosynthesis tyrosine autokinase [Deltaproteobacteria bacterium]
MRSIEEGLEKARRERKGTQVEGNHAFLQEWQGRSIDRSKLSAYLVSLLEPKSLAAEQFKRLRTLILRKMKSRMENTILVTSAVQGEGKTTTALNLAISVAQGMNETVLMIDTDLRKPGVHTHLGIEAERGLVDYLREECDLPELLVKTEVPKLTILPSGTPPENPSELLASNRMSQLLREVKGRYDNRFVILDTSPINVFTDTSILAPQVEGVLLVIKDGETPRDYVHRAIMQLEGTNLLGLILNQFSAPESLKDTYYYYYDYDYDRSDKSRS